MLLCVMVTLVNALLVAQLAVLPASALLALVMPVVVMVRCRRWAVPAVALWVVAVALLVVWVVASYQDGVRADEDGTTGDIFSSLQWLLDAVLAAAGSIAVSWWLHSRRVGRAPSR